MGRPPRFTREQVQAAALALVDAQGLAALSMRTLAAALGTGPMTLYNHVQDRNDLDGLVVDAVVAKIVWVREAREDWRDEVRVIATAVWQAVRAHPHVIPLILSRRSRSAPFLDLSEALLSALARGGHRDQALLAAFRAVTGFVMGFAQAELQGPLSAQTGGPEEAIARFQALPAGRYPRLVEIATAAAASDPAVEFRAGLDALLAGL
jgi:AcrR family transcriptional regulator